jgi:hypothetical protein
MNEIWKDVPNYEGLYQVSNLGNIKSLNYNKTKKEKVLLPNKSTNEYLNVRLYNNNKSKVYSVHQLVAIAFLNHNICGHKLVIDHINDNKLDNRFENLQIITNRENVYKNQNKGTSKYKGVNKSGNKWVARIRIKNERKYLGYFNCELAAHLAYQNKLKTI